MAPLPMNRPEVYVLSGLIGSGKTTRLSAWCIQQPTGTVSGVLAPVVNDQRHLCDIAGGECRNLEDLPPGTATEQIGRFTFNAKVFGWGRECLERAAGSDTSWVVVDEVGPLELAGGGLGPAVASLIELRSRFALVLVVRDYLVSDVLRHYSIPQVVRFPFA